MGSMKILLITLPRDGEIKDKSTPDYLLYDFMNYPPLGLLSIASAVDPRHTMEVLDTSAKSMNIEDVVAYIKKQKPDMLGMSVVTRRLFAMYAISKEIRASLPGTLIVVGGPHINYFPKETIALGTVDYVLPGFGEMRFSQLIEAIDRDDGSIQKIHSMYYTENGYTRATPAENVPVNIDDFPFPDRKLIRLDEYFTAADKEKMTTVYTSRGCPFHCIFCDVQEKKYHCRSPHQIVDEFEEIAEMGIGEIHIFDDTFNLNRQRVIDMCKEIIRRNLKISWSARARVHPFDMEMLHFMKKSGCRRLHVGVEAFDDRILDAIKKNISLKHIYNFFSLCNKLRIDTLAYFIVGFPQETEEYRKALFDKIKTLSPTYVFINILQPLPKTEYYHKLLEIGVFKKDYWKGFADNPVRDFDPPLCRSPELHTELVQLVDDIHEKFYLSPKFIVNDFMRNASLKMLVKKSKIALKLFSRRMRPSP